jgi:hypothetical protein
VGTTASVICRLEDASYEATRSPTLKRVAAVLDHRVEMHFLPTDKKTNPSLTPAT